MDELRKIPGVRKEISKDLRGIGIFRIKDLAGKDPNKPYDDMCRKQGVRLDPCMLYTMKCAVYFASNKTHDPELLKWWNWKDR